MSKIFMPEDEASLLANKSTFTEGFKGSCSALHL